MVKLKNGFQVLLFEVFLLKFKNDLISLFDFTESLAEYSQVCFNLLSSLINHLAGNSFDVINFTLAESFEELSVVRHCPVYEACWKLVEVFVLKLLRDYVIVINQLCYLLTELHQGFKVVIELEFIHFYDFDRVVLSWEYVFY